MQTKVFKWLTLAFAIALASSVVSMMAAFVGATGGDLRDLLMLQMLLVPVAIAVAASSILVISRRFGFRAAVATLPGWLIFALLSANSLVLIAELSFSLVRFHSGTAGSWQQHIPAAAALFCSVATAVSYVGMRLWSDEVPERPGDA